MSEFGERSAREQHELLDRQIRAHEERSAERVVLVRDAREQWESYGHVLRDHARRLEEVSWGGDPTNFFVRRRDAVRCELEAVASELVRGLGEELDAVEREVRAGADEELARLLREKDGVVWG